MLLPIAVTLQCPQLTLLFPLPLGSGKFSSESQFIHACFHPLKHLQRASLVPATILGSILRACAPYEKAEASHVRSLTAAELMPLVSPQCSPRPLVMTFVGAASGSLLFFPPTSILCPQPSLLGLSLATPYQYASDLKWLPSLANPPSSPPEPWPLLSQAATSGSGKCLHVSGAFWPLSFILSLFKNCIYYFNCV